MDGGIGQCKHQACGQTDALTYDGFCSDTCRMEATGCSVPECDCRGVCDGVSRCTSGDRYTWSVVDGRWCTGCREVPAEARP
jgi:hypothetical protein